MACACNRKDEKVKPNDTCLFCANKHISGAKALYNGDYKSINTLRIIAQLILASWHYNEQFVKERDFCLHIVDLILNHKEYKSQLINLNMISWNYVLNNQNSDVKYPQGNYFINKPEKTDFKDAMIAVALANQLYNYQLNYKSINKNYAMGQLILAAWHLQHEYVDFAKRCRQCWLKIQKLIPCSKQLNLLEKQLWNIYLEKNINVEG